MRILPIILLLLLTACMTEDNGTKKEIELLDAVGDKYGTATLQEEADGVSITLEVEGLTPGFHGTHIHENGECEAPDFTSAGDHFNPEDDSHGLMHPEGSHAGDLPNIEIDNSGKVEVELQLPNVTLLEGKNSLIQKGGTSLIIHEAQDDGVSQPSGDSGIRILCGEIKADEEI